MTNQAGFLFHDSLNDFLHPRVRNAWFTYSFSGFPAVKDAIEAIGVPHPEVDVILVNGAPVPFGQPLKTDDQVEVYPANPLRSWPEIYSLQAGLPVSDSFILDVHLGKLAKILRMLGLDTCYQNDYPDKVIAEIAQRENRRVLTRDIGLLKQKIIDRGYWLRSQHPETQLAEVITYFDLKQKLAPFTRCLACNVHLAAVTKESVEDLLPPKTRLYFNQFYQCPVCERVYWQGSHFEKMQEFVNRITVA